MQRSWQRGEQTARQAVWQALHGGSPLVALLPRYAAKARRAVHQHSGRSPSKNWFSTRQLHHMRMKSHRLGGSAWDGNPLCRWCSLQRPHARSCFLSTTALSSWNDSVRLEPARACIADDLSVVVCSTVLSAGLDLYKGIVRATMVRFTLDTRRVDQRSAVPTCRIRILGADLFPPASLELASVLAIAFCDC